MNAPTVERVAYGLLWFRDGHDNWCADVPLSGRRLVYVGPGFPGEREVRLLRLWLSIAPQRAS